MRLDFSSISLRRALGVLVATVILGPAPGIARTSPDIAPTVDPVVPATVPSLEALPIEQPIRVDGLLDDAAWSRAAVGDGFVQQEPDVGLPASQDTTVRVAFTDRTLYVAVRAFDDTPEALIARELGRDVSLGRDDAVSLLLDTFLDGRNGYIFATNPLASRNDSLVTDEQGSDARWDGIWRVATSRDAEGWTAEFAIPLSILRFDPENDVWGFQVRRSVQRRNEVTFWSPIRREESFVRVSRAGRLTGLAGLTAPRDLRVKPYVTAGSRRTRVDDAGGPPSFIDDETGDVGLDVKWGVTRGLTLDLTVNTDFAETEVDEQQVNLTRFSLFLPEKREFFQEHAGIFGFGPDLGPRMQLFFSRRIGIDDGRPVPLDFGLRLAGRQGPWSLGALGAATGALAADPTGDFDAVPAARFGVARFKRNVGERSYVGVMATSRRDDNGDNHVWGVDGSWKPTQRLELWGFASGSSGNDIVDGSSSGGAYGAGADYRSDRWSWNARSLILEDTFDPQVGFVRRSGVHNYNFEVTRKLRPDWTGIREIEFEVEADIFTLEDGTLETVDSSLDLFSFELESGTRVVLFTQYRFERLFEPFEIFDGVLLPVDEYEWVDFGVFGRTTENLPVSLRGFAVGGDFFDGKRLAHNLTLSWRPTPRWSLRTQWNRNDIEVSGGAFETNVWRQRVRYAWSTDLESSLFLQYSDAAELTAVNLRLAWRYRPGSDLFVVYNESWDSPELGDLIEQDRRLSLKLTYSFDL